MVFIKREWRMIEGVKEVKEGSLHLRRIIDLTFNSRASHLNVIIGRLNSRWSGESSLQANIRCSRADCLIDAMCRRDISWTRRVSSGHHRARIRSCLLHSERTKREGRNKVLRGEP